MGKKETGFIPQKSANRTAKVLKTEAVNIALAIILKGVYLRTAVGTALQRAC